MTEQKLAYEHTYQQTHSFHRKEANNPIYNHPHEEAFYERVQREDSSSKVASDQKGKLAQQDQKNKLRFILTMTALVTIIVCAILCALSGGGPVAWIGLGLTSIGIFLMIAVAIDKIQ